MITIANLNEATIKDKNFLFGFSLDTGDLTSVQIVEKTSDAQPSISGWLKEYPEDSETEEFKLADAVAYLSVHAGGWGRLKQFDLVFDTNGKLSKVEEV